MLQVLQCLAWSSASFRQEPSLPWFITLKSPNPREIPFKTIQKHHNVADVPISKDGPSPKSPAQCLEPTTPGGGDFAKRPVRDRRIMVHGYPRNSHRLWNTSGESLGKWIYISLVFHIYVNLQDKFTIIGGEQMLNASALFPDYVFVCVTVKTRYIYI